MVRARKRIVEGEGEGEGAVCAREKGILCADCGDVAGGSSRD